jgi:hypothetical protein
VVPVRLPSDNEAPSPKSIETLLTGLPGAVVTTLNTVASATVGVVVVVVTTTVGASLTATATVAEREPAVAVTVAALLVVSVVVASPPAALLTSVAPSVPEVVENDTGTPARLLPSASLTVAATVTVPPVEGTSAGFAVTDTAVAAAPPISTVIGVSVRALPENATSDAVPDCVPALSVTTACPLLVTASCGSRVPRVVVNVTSVPLCAGVPLCSMTVAMICAVPLTGRTLRLETMVMTDAVGASSGTFSQEPLETTATRLATTGKTRQTRLNRMRGSIT